MLYTGNWHQTFTYKELVYWDTTLEVLSIFELDWALVDFHQGGSIRFQMFWEQWSLSYTEFALLLGIFDIDFNNTQ